MAPSEATEPRPTTGGDKYGGDEDGYGLGRARSQSVTVAFTDGPPARASPYYRDPAMMITSMAPPTNHHRVSRGVVPAVLLCVVGGA